MKLRNIKIDCRNEDGTINKELSSAFQMKVTGGKHELYCGHAVHSFLENVSEALNSECLIVNEKGMISLCDYAWFFKYCIYEEVTVNSLGEVVRVKTPTEKQVIEYCDLYREIVTDTDELKSLISTMQFNGHLAPVEAK